MGTFWKYYSGQLIAPILTLVIGGNHEASNHLQELPFGGWLCPNIYYLGHAGVVDVTDKSTGQVILSIGGLSGIYKGRDYLRGRYERPPYSKDTLRSVYHVRNIDTFRFKSMPTGKTFQSTSTRLLGRG
jgi:lariat debranching enzyme